MNLQSALPVRPATKAERMRDCLRNLKQQNKVQYVVCPLRPAYSFFNTVSWKSIHLLSSFDYLMEQLLAGHIYFFSRYMYKYDCRCKNQACFFLRLN